MKRFFEYWFNNNEVGLYVKNQEIDFFNSSSKEVFGDFAIQIGLNSYDLLSHIDDNIKNYIFIGRDIICDSEFLPFKRDILSGIFLVHELDFCSNPRFLLKEVHRVLEPGGKLILTSLNPASFLWYLNILDNKFIPKRVNMIHYTKIKEWLELLGFQIILGKFMVYIPINISSKYLDRLKFLDIIGKRWWPYFSCVYGLVAIKNNYLIDPLIDVNVKKDSGFIIDSIFNPAKISSNKI